MTGSVLGTAVSPMRIKWLDYLATNGTTEWEQMPKPEGHDRHTSSRTWLPMVNAGWIKTEAAWHTETPGQRFNRRNFTITDAGRAVLAKVQK